MISVAESYLLEYRELLSRIASLEDKMAEAAVTGGTSDRLFGEKADLSRQAAAKKAELLGFIQGIGDDGDLRATRWRTALRLYYCELLSWGQIRGLLRPLVLRKGSPEPDLRKPAGISKTAMLRVREEALIAAEEAMNE